MIIKALLHCGLVVRNLERSRWFYGIVEVDDLAAFQRQFVLHQVDIAAGPMPRGDGVEQIFLYDPDGYFVEVFQRIGVKAPAPQRGPVPR